MREMPILKMGAEGESNENARYMKLSGKRTVFGHDSGKHMHRRSNSIIIEESLRLMTEIEAIASISFLQYGRISSNS